jgi:hypothetical protein
LQLETELEQRLADTPEFQKGVAWGVPRYGHPEGPVRFHIEDVLNNIERFYGTHPNRERLRLIALTHDTLKFRAEEQRALSHRRHHGHLAYDWASQYIDDAGVLKVIERHDDAFRIYRRSLKTGEAEKALARAHELIQELGPDIELFMQFYKCDNLTGDKSSEHYEWFKRLVETSTERSL